MSVSFFIGKALFLSQQLLFRFLPGCCDITDHTFAVMLHLSVAARSVWWRT